MAAGSGYGIKGPRDTWDSGTLVVWSAEMGRPDTETEGYEHNGSGDIPPCRRAPEPTVSCHV